MDKAEQSAAVTGRPFHITKHWYQVTSSIPLIRYHFLPIIRLDKSIRCSPYFSRRTVLTRKNSSRSVSSDFFNFRWRNPSLRCIARKKSAEKRLWRKWRESPLSVDSPSGYQILLWKPLCTMKPPPPSEVHHFKSKVQILWFSWGHVWTRVRPCPVKWWFKLWYPTSL